MFLSDITYKSTSIVAKFIGSLFSSYIENLHEDIGNGFSDRSSTILLSILFILICLLFIFIPIISYIYYNNFKNSQENISIEKKEMIPIDLSKKIKIMRNKLIFIISMSLVVLLLYSSSIFEIVYKRKAVLFLERSIEIVTPYITTSEYLTLRSKYRGIITASDFYKLEEELRKIAISNNIMLPDFTSIKP